MIFSYTLIDVFHNVCPRQAYERFVLKRPIEQTPELDHGTRTHKYIEERITGGAGLPDWLGHVEPVLVSMLARGGEASAEQKLAVNRQLQPTGFWDADAYLWGSVDFLLLSEPYAIVVDWKTGKKRDKELQLMLYALFVFAKWLSIERVTCLNYYVANEAPMGKAHTWHRAELSELWRTVLPLVHEIEQAELDSKWPERASPLCAWCPVTECQNWRPKRA